MQRDEADGNPFAAHHATAVCLSVHFRAFAGSLEHASCQSCPQLRTKILFMEDVGSIRRAVAAPNHRAVGENLSGDAVERIQRKYRRQLAFRVENQGNPLSDCLGRTVCRAEAVSSGGLFQFNHQPIKKLRKDEPPLYTF